MSSEVDHSNLRFEPNTKLIKLYIKWLESHNKELARQWGHRYRSDCEAAMCEAAFWDILTGCSVSVLPNEKVGIGGPDFRCKKDGCTFLVEVTCLTIDTVEKMTNLPHNPTSKSRAGFRGNLTDAFHRECSQKTKQCSGQEMPCLVAIGTFHDLASILCFDRWSIECVLTGKPKITWIIDTTTGAAIDEPSQATDFEAAAFLKRYTSGISMARRPVSGMLLAGLGLHDPVIRGVVHPDAAYSFDPGILDDIPFCQLEIDVENSGVSVRWTRDVPS